jgi:uracil-DNA glycosylase
VVVGEAPASGDPRADRWCGGNLTGAAYTSRHSGRRVRWLLAAAGYGDRTFYTNAVECFPAETPAGAAGDDAPEPGSDGSEVSNREPAPEERAACRRHLAAEPEAVAPDVVVPTGKHATASVLAVDGRTAEGYLGGFLDAVLEPSASSALGVPVLPLSILPTRQSGGSDSDTTPRRTARRSRRRSTGSSAGSNRGRRARRRASGRPYRDVGRTTRTVGVGVGEDSATRTVGVGVGEDSATRTVGVGVGEDSATRTVAVTVTASSPNDDPDVGLARTRTR